MLPTKRDSRDEATSEIVEIFCRSGISLRLTAIFHLGPDGFRDSNSLTDWSSHVGEKPRNAWLRGLTVGAKKEILAAR